MNLQPHQQRVVDEQIELNTKIEDLGSFLVDPIFLNQTPEEQQRLRSQHAVMSTYSSILNRRIQSFNHEKEDTSCLNKSVPVHVNAVPTEAKPIDSVDEFAMLVDLWHSTQIELGNRLLEIAEGTEVEVEDEAKPNEVLAVVLEGATLHTFRLGVMAALNLFNDLPFGASIESASDAEG